MAFSLLNIALTLLPLLPFGIAAPLNERAAPTVELSYATVVGFSSGGVDSFKQIPFAQPPTGELRLKPPQPINTTLGTLTLPLEAKSCPQFFFSTSTGSLLTEVLGDVIDLPFFQTVTNAGEDCLTVNVHRPSTATADSNLPVVFWIFGGGFELGSTTLLDESELVTASIAQNQDIIYVAVNYRTAAFGFLGGSEIKADGSSNLGLLDQRLGLQWVADNIALFGGDPDKVTIWGESAGAISVWDQMALYGGNITYKGKPLFRGAIMDSGSVIPAQDIDGPKAQAVYDQVVSAAGCSSAADTLECLRSVDYETFLNASNSLPGIIGYNSVALSYVPRPDGVVLTADPRTLAATGTFAKVPYIIGDQQDEGTLFSLFQTNLSTTADLIDYFQTIFFPNENSTAVAELVNAYPDDITFGSPFGTGILNNPYPQFKRLAAILGDLTFTLARRGFLEIATALNPDVPSWSYLATYGFGTPILGTFHGSDLLQIGGILEDFPTFSIQAYYLSFINNLDPNVGVGNASISLPNWPQWSVGNELLDFGLLTNSLTPDTFRQTQFEVIFDSPLQI